MFCGALKSRFSEAGVPHSMSLSCVPIPGKKNADSLGPGSPLQLSPPAAPCRPAPDRYRSRGTMQMTGGKARTRSRKNLLAA